MSDEADEGAGPESELEAVLVEWYLALDRGEAPELLALCGGDPALLKRVEGVLCAQPDSLRALVPGQAEPTSSLEDLSAWDFVDGRVGDFKILRLLGKGGMGAVFLARQESLGRLVALKVLDERVLSDERLRARFRREAEVAASLEHPNIAPVYEVGREGRYSYIAMRQLSGPGLEQLAGDLAPAEVARIGCAVARALEAAHLSGVIHRDVKPANIMLDDEVPYIVDFGLAFSQTDTPLTKQGTIPGTLPYLAPELLREDASRLDPSVDIYALGATMYELLRGKPPFAARDPEVLLRQIVTRTPRPLRLKGRDRDLEVLILKALDKEPHRRLPTAEALADDLQRYLDGTPILARPTSPAIRVLRLVRRHRTVSAALGLGLAGVLLAGVVTFSAGRNRERGIARELTAIQSAVDDHRFEQAWEQFQPLGEQHPKRSDLKSLDTELRSELALQRLLYMVMNGPMGVRADELRASLSEADEPVDSADHRRVLGLIRALAHWHLEAPDRALELLDALDAGAPPTRATAALRHLVDGDEGWNLPEEADASLEERVLIATAMFQAGRPLDLQSAELDLADRIDPAHPLSRFARAMVWVNGGEPERAARILEALYRAGSTGREITRNLARVWVATGRPVEARDVLTSIPRERWTSLEAYLFLQSYTLEDDWESFEAHLERFDTEVKSGRMNRDGVDLIRAEYLGHVRGNAEASLALFGELVDSSPDRVVRDLAAASAYQLRTETALVGLPADPGERSRALEQLAAEANRLLELLRWPRSVAKVHWKRGLVLLNQGYTGAGFQDLERAAELISDQPGPSYDYLRQVIPFLQAVERGDFELPEDSDAEYFKARARAHASSLHALAGRRTHRVPPAVLLDLVCIASYELGDWKALARVVPEMLEGELPEGQRTALEGALEQAQDHLERIHSR